jgi:serine phosphatase RsbU (regulator of sigma subunit)
METVRETAPEWGVASVPLAGESESGDSFVVKSFDKGVLVAVIDALGHGPDAARAARVAAAALEQHAHETPESLFRRCDHLMHETRGAAISVASFDMQSRTMTWLGVGNVTGALVRADLKAEQRVKQLMVRGGVVGFHLPELQASVVPVLPGDTLVLATDGVRADFTHSLPAIAGPQPLAEQILQCYATHHDDALVLVFPCGGAVRETVSSEQRRA